MSLVGVKSGVWMVFHSEDEGIIPIPICDNSARSATRFTSPECHNPENPKNQQEEVEWAPESTISLSHIGPPFPIFLRPPPPALTGLR